MAGDGFKLRTDSLIYEDVLPQVVGLIKGAEDK